MGPDSLDDDGRDLTPDQARLAATGAAATASSERKTSGAISDYEMGFRGPLYGYRGAALFGFVCAMPFISGISKGPPLASIAPGVVAYAMGFGWILGIMRLIHWLGSKPEWPVKMKRNILIGAFLALPATGWILAQIVTRF